MKTSNEPTVTDARMKEVLRHTITPIILETVPQMITQAVNDCKIRTGHVTKFYPYLDKAEVKLDNLNSKVLCRLSHRYVGALIDFYTPVGDQEYCDDLHEPCIIPREPLNCFIVKLHEDDSDDYLLVSYFHGENEFVDFVPPSQGNIRVSNFRASSEDYIEFGGDGLKIQTKKPIYSSYGEYEDDLTEPDYADSSDVYTKEEVYTKAEVDELIAEKIAEAFENLNQEDGED